MINFEQFGFNPIDESDPYYGNILYRSEIIDDYDLGWMDGYKTSYYIAPEVQNRFRIYRNQEGGFFGTETNIEQLFCGYITTQEELETILKLLKITKEERAKNGFKS
mgnify:CR=1 FL=1